MSLRAYPNFLSLGLICIFLGRTGAQAPDFDLIVEAPANLVGEAGGKVQFVATAKLVSDVPGSEGGVEGYSIGLAAEGGVILSATVSGTVAAPVPEGLVRLTNSFEQTELTSGPGNEGVTSAVVFSFRDDVTLPPQGTATLLQMTVEAPVPQPYVSAGRFFCAPGSCTIGYANGLVGTGEPIQNKVSLEGEAYRPTLGSAAVNLCPSIVEPSFRLSVDTPATVEGPAGSKVRFDAVARLTTTSNPTGVGVEGWSIAMAATGGEIVDATTAGTAGDIIPVGFRRPTSSFESTELTAGTGNVGVVSAVVLSYAGTSTLPTSGAVGLLRMTVEAEPPDPVVSGGQFVCKPTTCRVVYQNGLVGTGEPVDNKVSFRGLAYRPTQIVGITDVCPEISNARPDFALSVSAPATADGPALTPTRFEAVASLATTNAPDDEGAQGWSIGLSATGGEIVDATTTGTAGDLEPVGLRKKDGFESTEITVGEGNRGATSAVILSSRGGSTLPASGKVAILKVTVEVTPRTPSILDGQQVCDPVECRTFFTDGLRGLGEPVDNKVTYLGFAYRPTLGEATTVVCASAAGGIQKPGDENQDGTLDISDPISVLGFLFTGTNPSLPCGDGGLSDPGNIALLDVNGDGGIDLSDPIYTLSFLFTGGPRPVACTIDSCPCIVIMGCPSNPIGHCAP